MTGTLVRPEESRMLIAMDDAYLGQMAEERREERKAAAAKKPQAPTRAPRGRGGRR